MRDGRDNLQEALTEAKDATAGLRAELEQLATRPRSPRRRLPPPPRRENRLLRTTSPGSKTRSPKRRPQHEQALREEREASARRGVQPAGREAREHVRGAATACRPRLHRDLAQIAIAAARSASSPRNRRDTPEHGTRRSAALDAKSATACRHGLQAALAEAQAATSERERTLAQERERHAGELATQRDRVRQELGESLESLAAALATAAEERDGLRAEVGQLEKTLGMVRESSEAELSKVAGERDSITSELEEARELLRLAEAVRESQIALEGERDRLVGELERVEAIATAAQAEADEQARLLAEEQDDHLAERETLVTRQTELEEELSSAVTQLAAASAAADSRETELQLGSQKLAEALEAVRSVTSGLVSGGDLPQIPPTRDAKPQDEGLEPAGEAIEDEPAVEPAGTQTDRADYSLFVPGPNGYELVPQSGVPPQAGDIIELVLADLEEPARFEVLRSSRTLPAGDICVYLAPV